MPVTHLKITQASLISALTFVVGQVVAFVPTLGTDKQNLISAGSTAIALGFIIANSIHALASSKNPVGLIESQLPKIEEIGGKVLAQASQDVNKGASASEVISQAVSDEQELAQTPPVVALAPEPAPISPAPAAPAPAPASTQPPVPPAAA